MPRLTKISIKDLDDYFKVRCNHITDLPLHLLASTPRYKRRMQCYKRMLRVFRGN